MVGWEERMQCWYLERYFFYFILKKYCQMPKELGRIPGLYLLTFICRMTSTDRLTVLKQDSSNVQANTPAWKNGIAKIISFVITQYLHIFTFLQDGLSITEDNWLLWIISVKYYVRVTRPNLEQHPFFLQLPQSTDFIYGFKYIFFSTLLNFSFYKLSFLISAASVVQRGRCGHANRAISMFFLWLSRPFKSL